MALKALVMALKVLMIINNRRWINLFLQINLPKHSTNLTKSLKMVPSCAAAAYANAALEIPKDLPAAVYYQLNAVSI